MVDRHTDCNREPAARRTGGLGFRLLLPRLDYGHEGGSHGRGDVGQFDDIKPSLAGFVFAYKRLRHAQLLSHLYLCKACLATHLPQQRAQALILG
ncbi:Uncharacterised protein [Mycobacteroides abscessus subsp. bolletii]|nr:Uncharacterised protein [Mycobacteroides abscessus subsp. bolletii]SKE77512.1 Uncharacterised protein [Mycobacteroides abscessus subsp. bolletii]SKE81448.1 Uncharacterised protein [Mycobacteroides abscessus subsp. bolletii]SKE90731.1 Uncharacterised protein [Mycobacteroides abscessus subsp. bolletii]SKF34498.1 Uncharacterised protein [Mycobacteroides abscessus subsp. bolletii]